MTEDIQAIKTTIKTIKDLSKGMDRCFDETLKLISEAIRGKPEAFDSLRDLYGITTRELISFGAPVDIFHRLKLSPPENLEQVGRALLILIEKKHGGNE